jgi:hypothetical protein
MNSFLIFSEFQIQCQMYLHELEWKLYWDTQRGNPYNNGSRNVDDMAVSQQTWDCWQEKSMEQILRKEPLEGPNPTDILIDSGPFEKWHDKFLF